MRLALTILTITLAGCASDGGGYDTRLLDAQRSIATKDTLTVDCPAGCKVTYTDPRDRAAGLKPRTSGWDVLNTLTDRVTGLAAGAVVPAAMYGLGKEGFRALQGSGAQTSTTTTTTSNSVDSHAVSTTTDSTHAPTVVTQPAPVVVAQPTPIVVTQPTPIVVSP